MAFGAIIMLNASFPTYVPISKRLDVSDPHESKVASAHLLKLKDHCHSMAEKMRGPRRERLSMELNMEYYHVKTICRKVYDGGLGHFDGNKSFPSIQRGVLHMIRVLNKLYSCPATRETPEYPLSIRTPDSTSPYYDIIYRNISTSGYVMGCPNRLVDVKMFDMYVAELNSIVHDLYFSAGVIHGDLYASNIMWKCENRMSIKIVDWDGAHCVEEGNFCDEIRARLESYFDTRKEVAFNETHDLTFVEVFHEAVTEENKQNWADMASSSKGKIDRAFYQLLMNRLEN
jgi:hypothetical protein